MESKDTIYLLKECDAGTKMAVASFDEVPDKTNDSKLKQLMRESKNHHEELGNEIHELLISYHSDAYVFYLKRPPPAYIPEAGILLSDPMPLSIYDYHTIFLYGNSHIILYIFQKFFTKTVDYRHADILKPHIRKNRTCCRKGINGL